MRRIGCKKKTYSPKAGHHATKEEHAVALDEGREEGEEAVDGHGDQQALLTAHFVRKPSPEEGSEHHPQIHDATWRRGRRHGGRVNRVFARSASLLIKNNKKKRTPLFLCGLSGPC